MAIIKLYIHSNTKVGKNVKADTLNELKEKTIEKFGFVAKRFVMKSDGSEIDDEDVFAEILNEHPKGLELIALREAEEYEPAASTSIDLNNVANSISNPASLKQTIENDLLSDWLKKKQTIEKEMKRPISFSKKDFLDSFLGPGSSTVLPNDSGEDDKEKIKREKEMQEELALQIKKLEKPSELQTETETTRMLREKLDRLRKQTIETKEAKKSRVRELELKVAKIELSNHRIANIFHELKQAEKVDICFMMDCTGSMGSYINEAKTVIHKISSRLSNTFQNLSLRFAFVGYRDHGDKAERVTVYPFSQNADGFKSFVTNVSAKGGDDQCEDIFGGLEEVIKLDWEHMSRVLFHIADAPCHGARFHVGAGDNYPAGDPRGLKIENLLKSLVDQNITYYFAQINESTVKMIDEFNEEIANLNGPQIKVVNLKAADGLTETVMKSVTCTIHESKSKSMASAHGKTLKPKKIIKLDWDNNTDFKEYEVTLYKPIYDFTIKDVKTTKIRYSAVETQVFMASQPFSQGALRFAQAAYLVDPDSGAKKRCVVKESKFNDPSYNTRKYVEESIECQVISIFLAHEFEKVSPSKKSLKFVDINYIKVKDTGAYFSIEEYMEGEFFKMSNNAGFLDEDCFSATLDTFMHWSHQLTSEYLVVTDLQGVRTPTNYVLTDPAITCPEDPDRFSVTNLGRRGLKEVFKSHKCNHMCQKLNLIKQAFQQTKDIRKVTHGMTQMK